MEIAAGRRAVEEPRSRSEFAWWPRTIGPSGRNRHHHGAGLLCGVQRLSDCSTFGAANLRDGGARLAITQSKTGRAIDMATRSRSRIALRASRRLKRFASRQGEPITEAMARRGFQAARARAREDGMPPQRSA